MTERVSLEEGRRLLAKSEGHQPESVILAQVRQYLRTLGWYVVRMQQGLGCHRGIADLYCLKDGHGVWIECKTAKGKLSEHQQRFQEEIEAHGGTYVVARSLEDVTTLGREQER